MSENRASGSAPLIDAWRPAARPSSLISVTVQALLQIDLTGRAPLIQSLGDYRASEVVALFDERFQDLVDRHGGREIARDDGILALFEHPSDAVRCALACQEETATLSADIGPEVRGLAARAAVHAGEVVLRRNAAGDVARGARPLELEGLTRAVTLRLLELALPGQLLVSRVVADTAWEQLRADADGSKLERMAQGEWRLPGIPETVEVVEIGRLGRAPFKPLRRRGRRVAMWLAAALLLVVALTFLLTRPLTASHRPVVAVLGFKDLSPQAEDAAWLGTALAELLAVELADGGDLTLVPGESIARVQRDLGLGEVPRGTLSRETLEGIRLNTGSDYVVTGSFFLQSTPGDGVMKVILRLQANESGREVVTVNEDGDPGDPFALVAQASDRLRAELRVRRADGAPAARTTVSASRTANQLYFEGLQALRDLDAAAARPSLERAVREDPGFALAHTALSEAYNRLGYERLARESAERAYRLSGDLPAGERRMIEGRYYLALRDWSRAIQAYRALRELQPENVDHGLRLAAAQHQAGRSPDALLTLQELRALPLGDDPRIDVAEAEVTAFLGEARRAVVVAHQAISKGEARGAWSLIGEAYLRLAHAYYQFGQFKEQGEAYAKAARHFEEAGDRRAVADVLNGQAILSRRLGDLKGAQQRYQQALAIYQELGNQEGTARIFTNLATLLQQRGDPKTALDMAEKALEVARAIDQQRTLGVKIETLGWVLYDLGRLDEAADRGVEAVASYTTTSDRNGVAWASLLLGKVALARGRPEDAGRQFNAALDIARETGERDILGNAFVELSRLALRRGDLDESRRHLDEAAGLARELGDEVLRGVVELQDSRLALAAGNAAQAVVLGEASLQTLAASGRVTLQLEARIALAQARRAAGDAKARRELTELADEADRHGLALVGREAREGPDGA